MPTLRRQRPRESEILGKNIFTIFPDNPSDPEASGVSNLRTSLENVVRTKAQDTMAVQKYDIRLPESEGGGFEERFWSPLNTPVLDDDGSLRYIIHRVEDVTEFVLLKKDRSEQNKAAEDLKNKVVQIESEIFMRAQEIQKANRRLETMNNELALRENEVRNFYEQLAHLDRQKTQFFANVSHELRTPISLILGPVDKLLSQTDLSETQKYSGFDKTKCASLVKTSE